MNIDIKIEGLAGLQSLLRGFSDRRIRAAQATALTRTAVVGLQAGRDALFRDIDKPTPYTARQLRYVGATADKLSAAVGFTIAAIQDIHGDVVRYQDLGPGQTPAGKYLQFQIDGGQREAKRFEKALRQVGVLPDGWLAVPGAGAKVDGYGNQSPGEIRQILSWFDAAELVAGSRQNMRVKGRHKRREGTKRKAGWEYFSVQPGATRRFVRGTGGYGTHKLHPGIYRRTMYALGNRIEPIMIFIPRASYRSRLRWYGDVQQALEGALYPNMQRAIQEHVDRLAQRGDR